jgi:putative peptidoglycan lipid II flippase
MRDTIVTTVWGSSGKLVGFLTPFFIAAWFGVSGATDIFFFAYGIIIFLATIFSNSIENVIVPFIVEVRSRNEADVGIFISQLILLSAAALLIVIAPLLFFTHIILGKVTNFTGLQQEQFLRIVIETTPLILLLIVNGVLSGMLNAYKLFVFPAIMPAVRSIVTILTIFLLKAWLGIYAIPLGYIAGELSRLLLLWFLVILRHLPTIKFSLIFDKEILVFVKALSYQMAARATLGLNPIINKAMASWLPQGSVSILEYADKIYTVPISLLSDGLMVTTLSYLSADYYGRKKDEEKLRTKVVRIGKIIFIASLLVTVLLAIFSDYIVKLVYGYGVFPKEKTGDVGLTWIMYLFGLVPYMLIQVMMIECLVLKKTKIVMKTALFMNLLNIGFNLVFMKIFGVFGIALSTSVIQAIGLVILYIFLINTRNHDEAIA